jgi:hypothetical protein
MGALARRQLILTEVATNEDEKWTSFVFVALERS